MAANKKNKGLGKGLESLFGTNEHRENDVIRSISVDLIDNNPDQPRKQFDEEKAWKRKTLDNGFEEFVIYMSLGVNKKRTFRTVWRRDDMDIRPRFITAYRDKEGEQYV